MSEFTQEIKNLNVLLAKTQQAEKDFKIAAEKVERPLLQKYLNNKANRRSVFAVGITTAIRNLGGIAEPNMKIEDHLANGWINIKTALSFDKEEALIEACEEAEERSLHDYRTILNNPKLPSSCRTELQKQHDEVQSTARSLDSMMDD